MRGKGIVLAGTLTILLASGTGPAFAHCDTLDGPVVTEARAALQKGDVTPALKWVKKENEEEIRTAFRKTLAVRARGDEARELADLWFFETLVRLHRAGEGEPYTGLKPAGTEPGPAVRAADKALETGSVDELARKLGDQAAESVRERFLQAIKTKKHADHDIEAGREYVKNYVRFVHHVERLHKAVSGQGSSHEGPSPAAAERKHEGH